MKCASILLACAFPAAGFALTVSAAEPVAFLASAKVEIDAGGRLAKVEASPDLPDGIREYIEKRVAKLHFFPPSRDGATGTGVTYLQLGACAFPVEGGYRMGLDVKSNGPRPRDGARLIPPAYPHDAQRAGEEADLLVHWIVEPDGNVTLENIERKDGIVLRKGDSFYSSIRDWVRRLRFDPEQLAGKAVRTRMSVPVEYSLEVRPGAMKRELQENARRSRECRMAAFEAEGPQPVALDSPVKILDDEPGVGG